MFFFKNNKKRKNAKACIYSVLLLVVTFPHFQQAHAKPITIAPFYMAEYSDNVERSATNQQAGWINTAGLSLTQTYLEKNFEATLDGLFGFRHYDSSTAYNESIMNFSGELEWKVVPENLSFYVADFLTHIPISRFETSERDNEQSANIFVFGPTIQSRINSRHSMLMDIRGSWVYDEETESDRSNFSLAPEWKFNFTKITDISLIYNYSAITYLDENQAADDYDRNDIFFQIANLHKIHEFTLDVGASQIKFDNNQVDKGEIGRFTWKMKTSADSFVTAFISTGYGDLISDYQRGSAIISAIDNQLSVVDVFRQDRIEISYSKDLYESNILFRLYAEDVDRFTIDERERRQNATFEYSTVLPQNYSMGGILSPGLILRYNRLEFNNLDNYNEVMDGTLVFNFLMNRNFLIRAEYRRIKTHSTVIEEQYGETIIGISFSYNSEGNNYMNPTIRAY